MRTLKSGVQVPPGAPKSLQLGPLAQLVERCIRIAEISGSNPLRSTIFNSEGYRSGHNGLVSKTKRGENHPGVRIPLPPPVRTTVAIWKSPQISKEGYERCEPRVASLRALNEQQNVPQNAGEGIFKQNSCKL